MHTAYLLLGSNMGDRGAALQQACALLKKYCTIAAVSSVAETEPWGVFALGDEALPFYNQVVCVKTVLGPQRLMAACLEIERAMGRERKFLPEKAEKDLKARVYHSRLIDIDILLFDTLTGSWEEMGMLPALDLPHPRLQERPFALALLREIKPDYTI